jgi:hypothetical protein
MFTDGNIPPGLLQLPQTDSDWTSDEVQSYQQMFDSLLAGNDQQRSRIRVVPPGTTYAALDDMEMTTEFDKFLLNVTVAAMGLSMADLGFTEDVNRSSGDSQENMTYRRTMQPLMNMYAELFTRVLRDYFDEDRFIVTWGGFEESEDLEMQASAYSNLVQHGILSPSDAARAMHMPVHFEMGPMLVTKDGPVLLEDFADPEFRAAQKQARLAGLQLAANPQQPQQNGQEKDQEVPAKDEKGNAPPTQPAQAEKQKNGEDNTKDETQPTVKRAAIGEAVPVFEEQEQATTANQIRAEDAERPGEVQHIAQVARSKDDATASNGASEDYRRWRSRAIEDVKSGRALRPFTSTLIPTHEQEWIRNELERCTAVEEVRDVFNRARSLTENAPSNGGVTDKALHWQDTDKEIQKKLATLKEQGVQTVTWKAHVDCCDACAFNDNVTKPLGTRFVSGAYIPPNHPNCACEAVYGKGDEQT